MLGIELKLAGIQMGLSEGKADATWQAINLKKIEVGDATKNSVLGRQVQAGRLPRSCWWNVTKRRHRSRIQWQRQKLAYEMEYAGLIG